jgi:hypothetical protein
MITMRFTLSSALKPLFSTAGTFLRIGPLAVMTPTFLPGGCESSPVGGVQLRAGIFDIIFHYVLLLL